jgi:solute carrier family 25 (peroxisomal adenine nucleotide transporter), member 17
VIQTAQAVETMEPSQTSGSNNPGASISKPKRLGFIQTIERLVAQDGISAFWRGIGPALILVINPVIQYTAFEQLKNLLVKKRTERLRKAGIATAVAVLTDWDFFLLGAISKLGGCV